MQVELELLKEQYELQAEELASALAEVEAMEEVSLRKCGEMKDMKDMLASLTKAVADEQ